MKLKYFLQRFEWSRVYFSPFKPPKLKIYIGKTAIGTPYFLPRVWVKGNHKLIHEGVLRCMDETGRFNERNSEYKRKGKSYDELYEEMKTYSFSVPKKIGFNFVDLGWKTKWTSTDYRFEWNPVWSFVFFGYQLAITFVPIEPHHYWECWLYYSRETKGTTKERLKQARKEFPCVWSSTRDGVKTTTCYWDVILKNKYL
jgi:hypothetical protein